MAEIVPADDDAVARFYGVQITSRWTGRAMLKGRLVAGFGGVMEIEDGVWFAWLDVPARLRRPAIYRHAVRVLDELKRNGAKSVRAVCDDSIPRAVAMLERLGFEPTDETTADEKQVWECRV